MTLSLSAKPDSQLDTDHFTEWADEKRMAYDFDKCKSVTFEGKIASSDPLLLKSNVIPTVDSIKGLGINISKKITSDKHIQNKMVAARKAHQFLKRTVSCSVSLSTKPMYFCLCVQSNLLYWSQVWYTPNIYRRKLEHFNEEYLFSVTWWQNFSQQLAASNKLPISYFLALYDVVFLKKAKNNKYDSNPSNYICLSTSTMELRSSKHQQIMPVKRCHKLSTRESFFKGSVTTSTSSLHERWTFLTHLKNINTN